MGYSRRKEKKVQCRVQVLHRRLAEDRTVSAVGDGDEGAEEVRMGRQGKMFSRLKGKHRGRAGGGLGQVGGGGGGDLGKEG